MTQQARNKNVVLDTYAEEIVHSLTCPVLVTDSAGTISYLNPAARTLLGLDAHRSIGKSCQDIFAACEPQEAGEHCPPLQQVLTARRAVFGAEIQAVVGGQSLSLRLDAIPLLTDLGNVGGVLMVVHDRTEEEALHAEHAWTNRELVARRRQVDELLGLSQALNAISETIHSALDSSVALERVVQLAVNAIGATRGFVEVREHEDWRVMVAVPHEKGGGRARRHREVVAGLAVAESPHSLVVRDPEGRYYTLLRAPLLLKGKLRGTLAFEYSEVRQLPDSFIDFVMQVAATTSLALENATLYEQEHHIATTLQNALIVAPLHVDGVKFWHRYQSATEAASVGGDFYDIFGMPDRAVGIVMGDVSGKGIEASTLASFARQLIRAYAQDDPDPSNVLRRVNKLLYRVSAQEEFVTVFFGVLHLEDGRLHYTNGGHPTPLVITGNSVVPLEGTSPMTGAFLQVGFGSQESHLAHGDVLVLYTDGLIEAKRGGELYSQERLMDELARLSSVDVAAWPDRLLATVADYAQGDLRDDIAIFCCRRD